MINGILKKNRYFDHILVNFPHLISFDTLLVEVRESYAISYKVFIYCTQWH